MVSAEVVETFCVTHVTNLTTVILRNTLTSCFVYVTFFQIHRVISRRTCANGNSPNQTTLTGHDDQVVLLPPPQGHQVDMEEEVGLRYPV